jgi:outer membrane protein
MRRTGDAIVKPHVVAASAFAVGAILIGCKSNAQTQEKPLWELGAGVGAIAFADYRGADEYQIYPLPLPYAVYRGKLWKTDREGVRGELWDRTIAELSISLGGSIPVDSDDKAARRGMPDLKPTIEIGPSLDVHLWQSDDSSVKVDLILPLRVPVTIESSPRLIGLMFSPKVSVLVRDISSTGWDLSLSAGPMFANEKYHDYFYSVAPRFALPERPAYRAERGFSGSHVFVSLTKRFPRYWVGGYVRVDSVHGAAFDDSPLVKRDYSFTGGIGIAWIIAQSKQMVQTDE